MTELTYRDLCLLEECVKRRCEQYVVIPPRLLELHEKLLKMIKEVNNG